jgi:hypothetical protein
MADFLYPELSPKERDHVVRSHTFGFVHQQDPVRNFD